ncbi:MAG TPA: cytochrome c oxidase assembly protein [Xanthobacteraceae bacterium]|nr:cytochrome c oxidase assembly protein [Xanthobacteraceae bacterium]
MTASQPTERSRRRRDLLVAAACGVFAAGMVGMAFAAVPLYDWFCRTTGFAGTPMTAKAAPANVLDRKIIVRLDANVAGALPWRFMPEKNFVEVRVGDVLTVNYIVVNESAQEIVGNASYNVSPPTVGAYFTKINCFCFTEQRLKPHERREMPVVFFIDPKIAEDSEHDGLNTITLSYTMYRVRQSEPQTVGSAGAGTAPSTTN